MFIFKRRQMFFYISYFYTFIAVVLSKEVPNKNECGMYKQDGTLDETTQPSDVHKCYPDISKGKCCLVSNKKVPTAIVKQCIVADSDVYLTKTESEKKIKGLFPEGDIDVDCGKDYPPIKNSCGIYDKDGKLDENTPPSSSSICTSDTKLGKCCQITNSREKETKKQTFCHLAGPTKELNKNEAETALRKIYDSIEINCGKDYFPKENNCGLTGKSRSFDKNILPSDFTSCTNDKSQKCCYVKLKNPAQGEKNYPLCLTTNYDIYQNRTIAEKRIGAIYFEEVEANCGYDLFPTENECGQTGRDNRPDPDQPPKSYDNCRNNTLTEKCCYAKSTNSTRNAMCVKASNDSSLRDDYAVKEIKNRFGDQIYSAECGRDPSRYPKASTCGSHLGQSTNATKDQCKDQNYTCCYLQPSDYTNPSLCYNQQASFSGPEAQKKQFESDFRYLVKSVECEAATSSNFISSSAILLAVVIMSLIY
jgi:hypothetical protein